VKALRAVLLIIFLCAVATAQNVIPSPATVAQLNNRIYVDGTKYSFTQSGIQQALTDACAQGAGNGLRGTEVFLPPNQSVTVSNGSGQQFLITCPLQVHGAGASSFWFVEAAGTAGVPLFRIAPSQNFEGYSWEFDHFRITQAVAGAGGDTFFLDFANGEVNGLDIHDVVDDGPSRNINAWFLNMNATIADQAFLGHIWDNVIQGGINFNSTSIADSWLIEHNTFNAVSGNLNPCMNLTTEPGSAHFTAFNNNGGCLGGFVISHGTTQCKILYNQIEQPGPSTEANSAIIDLIGDTYAIDGCEIVGNNINAHTFANTNVRLDHADNATIDGNVLSVNGGGIGIFTTVHAGSIMAGLRNQFSLGTGATVWGGPVGSITFGSSSVGGSWFPGALYTNAPRVAYNNSNAAFEYEFLSQGNAISGVQIAGIDAFETFGRTAASGHAALWADTGSHLWRANNNGGGSYNLVGDTTPQILTNKTLVSPVITGTVSWAGIQHARDVSCSTPAALNGSCTTSVGWSTAFLDNAYTASCSINGSSVFVRSIGNQLSGSVNVTIQNAPGVSSASSGTIECIAVHD
jgi:hypothetical protein